jgi:Arc/MetJ family transcription regulator
MRIKIILDDDLMQEALAVTGLPTKKAVVEAGLRLLIQMHKQTGIRSMKGQIHWEGNLDEQRQARFIADK